MQRVELTNFDIDLNKWKITLCMCDNKYSAMSWFYYLWLSKNYIGCFPYELSWSGFAPFSIKRLTSDSCPFLMAAIRGVSFSRLNNCYYVSN
jgi:hypothetical protein